RFQVYDRITTGRAEGRSLIGGRHEACAPVTDSSDWSAAWIGYGHECRQAAGFRTQSICDPGAHCGITCANLSRLQFIGRLNMVIGPCVDRSQDGHFVGMLTKVWKDLRELDPAFPVLLELEWARHQWAGPALANINVAFARQRFSRVF